MTTPANAYAPGSPGTAAGQGTALGVAQKMAAVLGFGGPSVAGIGIGASSSTSSGSGWAGQNAGYDGSDFNVNFGNGVSQGAGIPSWVLLLAALVGLYAWTR